MLIQKIKNKFEELFGIDLRALALMRIVFSLIVIVHLIERAFSLKAFYTDQGVLPRSFAIMLPPPPTICVHFMNDTMAFAVGMFVLMGLCALCVLVGYRTRLFTFLTWFLLQSLHARNDLIDSGADMLLQIIFFWCIFLPWGEYWSMDQLKHKSKDYPKRVFSMASVAYLLQIVFVYSFAGISKIQDDSNNCYKDGTALYYVFHMDAFVKPLGHYFLHFPVLLKYLSLSVSRLELWGGILLFFPLATRYVRLIVISAFIFLHAGMLLTIETGDFQWIIMASLLGFLPAHFLDKIFFPIKTPLLSEKNNASSRNYFHTPFYVNVILALLIFYVFLINISHLKNKPFMEIPQQIQWVRYTLGIDQHWNMFAPVETGTGWLIIPAKLRDGSIVDIFRGGKPVTSQKPLSVLDSYGDGDGIWGKYDWNLHLQQFYPYHVPYGQYLCSTWNGSHPWGKQLMAFDIIYMRADTLPDNKETTPKQYLLFTGYCYEPVGPVPAFKAGELSL